MVRAGSYKGTGRRRHQRKVPSPTNNILGLLLHVVVDPFYFECVVKSNTAIDFCLLRHLEESLRVLGAWHLVPWSLSEF
jgi:hypothetical protein